MSLTKKRKKELDRLRSDAQDLWGQQQEVLANANALAAAARKQAAYYSREEIAPRVRAVFEKHGLAYNSRPLPQQVYSAWHKIVRLSLPEGGLRELLRRRRPRRVDC